KFRSSWVESKCRGIDVIARCLSDHIEAVIDLSGEQREFASMLLGRLQIIHPCRPWREVTFRNCNQPSLCGDMSRQRLTDILNSEIEPDIGVPVTEESELLGRRPAGRSGNDGNGKPRSFVGFQ